MVQTKENLSNGESFVVYESYETLLNHIKDDAIFREAVMSMFEFWLRGNYNAEWKNSMTTFFMDAIIPSIKSAQKRRKTNIENGLKWWRPKKDWDNSQKPKETEPKPNDNRKKPNHNLNVNVNVNDNVNVKDNVKVNVNKNKSELDNKEKPNELEEIKDNSEVDIEELIDKIIDKAKTTIEKCWWVYDSKNERKFAKELLTNKDVIQWRQEHYKCTLFEFIINTIKASYVSYNYPNRVDSLFKLFYNYQSIYNNTISSPKEDKNIKYTFYINHYNWNRTYVEKRKAIADFVTKNIPLPR